jgi:hypothetical protein
MGTCDGNHRSQQNPTNSATKPQWNLPTSYTIRIFLQITSMHLSKTNTNWQHPMQLQQTRNSFKQAWQHSFLQPSHPKEKFISSYQPGGTLTAVTGDWTLHAVDKGMDPHGLGRWSYVIIRGKRDSKAVIIPAYRVGDNRTASPKTAYRQQARGLSNLHPEAQQTESNPH